MPLFKYSLQTVLHACTCFYIPYLCALLVKFRACVFLQPTFSHTYDISAAQGPAPYQGLGLQSVTMQTTAAPARSHSSPTCLQVAELPLQTLQHNPGAPQLHPYTSSGQLHSEGQRVQLQGLWLHSSYIVIMLLRLKQSKEAPASPFCSQHKQRSHMQLLLATFPYFLWKVTRERGTKQVF